MSQEDDFLKALRAGDAAAVEALIAAHPGLVLLRHAGASAILLARYRSAMEVVEALRPHLPELDIFEAAVLGDFAEATRLLDLDATLANAAADDGFGPLGLASFFAHEPIVRLLLRHGAHVAEASSNRMKVMPLHSAAAARSVPIARLLLEHGAPVDARQGHEQGFTPLMEAALNGQMDLVELLLSHGADAALIDQDGLSAGDHARASGHEALARRLQTAPPPSASP